MKRSNAEQGTKWLLQKWLQMGAAWHGAKSKEKGEVKEEWMIERGRAATQWISHSRPGLSAGGCARGEITGLLPRWSLHRHTATDRKLLAPGRLTDSPQHCLSTAIFSFTHVQLTKLDLHVDLLFALCNGLNRFQSNRWSWISTEQLLVFCLTKNYVDII